MTGVSFTVLRGFGSLMRLKRMKTESVLILAGRDDVQRFERQGLAGTLFNLRV